jgi:hypothetical protein
VQAVITTSSQFVSVNSDKNHIQEKMNEPILPYIMKLQSRIALFDFELDQEIGKYQVHLLLTVNQRVLKNLSRNRCCYSKLLQQFH